MTSTRNPPDPESMPELVEECSCPKTQCERRYRCRECVEYHAYRSPRNKLPHCLREPDPADP